MLGKSQCLDASSNMESFLEAFVNHENGVSSKDVWHPVIEFVDKLSEWVGRQSGPSWHLISVSLLVIYEGMATDADGLLVRCALVDFAHTFFVGHGPDDNVLRGLQSLRQMLADLC